MPNSERIRPPWWLKYVNTVMIAVNRTGLLKDGPAVLTVTGRKTGRTRSTPVTPFEVDGRRYVVGGLPGSDWVRNAQANPEAVLTRGGKREAVRMVELPPARPDRCCDSSRYWYPPVSAS